MSQLICAYCKCAGAMTREHLWPASLHRRLYNANQQTSNTFWLARLRKAIPSEPQIKDVCAQCNNGILSDLDSYICELFDSTFIYLLSQGADVRFEYDYHRLKRWLLKLCFNSARIHNSADLFALEALLPYILGKSEGYGGSTQLFLQLAYPQQVPDEDLPSEEERPYVLHPSVHRVGFMQYIAHGIGSKLLRAIHLRSYSFYLAFWKPGNGKAEQRDFADVFTRHFTGTVLLRPSQSAISLCCNGVGAWDSIKHSQTELVNAFDADA